MFDSTRQVPTRIGDLHVEHDDPSNPTVERLCDEIDFRRACSLHVRGDLNLRGDVRPRAGPGHGLHGRVPGLRPGAAHGRAVVSAACSRRRAGQPVLVDRLPRQPDPDADPNGTTRSDRRAQDGRASRQRRRLRRRAVRPRETRATKESNWTRRSLAGDSSCSSASTASTNRSSTRPWQLPLVPPTDFATLRARIDERRDGDRSGCGIAVGRPGREPGTDGSWDGRATRARPGDPAQWPCVLPHAVPRIVRTSNGPLKVGAPRRRIRRRPTWQWNCLS